MTKGSMKDLYGECDDAALQRKLVSALTKSKGESANKIYKLTQELKKTKKQLNAAKKELKLRTDTINILTEVNNSLR